MIGRKIAVAGALAAMLSATAAQAAIVYGVDENNTLVRFDSAAPGATLGSVAITGLSDSLSAIDFRPLNGLLYGLGIDRIVYSINLATGAATAISNPLALTGSEFAFDFNPTIDRLRIVSNTNQNYVFNPNDGSLTTATDVAYAAGDVNAGKNPHVVAAAYTSSVFGAAAGTTQLFSIDTAADVLVTQANSAGTLATRGPLGFDLGSRTSFDIDGSNAFVQNGRNFYSINLATGALRLIGQTDRSLFGISVLATAVPEPATWATMLLGFALVGLVSRRRQALVRFA